MKNKLLIILFAACSLLLLTTCVGVLTVISLMKSPDVEEANNKDVRSPKSTRWVNTQFTVEEKIYTKGWVHRTVSGPGFQILTQGDGGHEGSPMRYFVVAQGFGSESEIVGKLRGLDGDETWTYRQSDYFNTREEMDRLVSELTYQVWSELGRDGWQAVQYTCSTGRPNCTDLILHDPPLGEHKLTVNIKKEFSD